MTNRRIENADEAGNQLPGRVRKVQMPTCSKVSSLAVITMTCLSGLLLIQVNAAPEDVFLNAYLFISVVHKGVVELLVKSWSGLRRSLLHIGKKKKKKIHVSKWDMWESKRFGSYTVFH